MRHLTFALLGMMCAVPGATLLAAEASLGNDGRVRVDLAGDEFFTLGPIAATPAWSFGSGKPESLRQDGPTRRFIMTVGGKTIDGEALVSAKDGGAELKYTFVSGDDMDLAALAVSAEFAASTLIGGTWQADAESGNFPAELGSVHLFNAPVQKLSINANGKQVEFNFPQPTPVMIQDNRQWGPTFAIRLGRQTTKLAKGDRYELQFAMRSNQEMAVTMDSPVVITANDQWIPLDVDLEIEPGSALDFSGMGFVDAPAGKHGWLKTDGRDFVFENLADRPQRFYGVNFCFSAHYIPHERIDQLCDRLVRLGYNTVRFHHHEGGLTNNQPGFDWIPEKLDQLDYFFAACKKRGIYVTTDLYVSRPVSAQQVQMEDTASWAYRFKVLVPVHEPAFQDWEKFTRMFLDRVNPHTGMRWADDPALAWIAMINEGNIGNYWNDVKKIPQWTTAWNAWLAKRYPDRDAIAKAWGDELKADENAAGGTVALPDSLGGNSMRQRDCTVFVAETELAMYQRMEKFVRDLGCKALLTNMNAWTNHAPNQLVREQMDYVDDHFYVDHPQFIERDWQLPSRSPNDNPVRRGAPGGRPGNNLRLLDRPFTVSEYNYSGPGRFRGVGGILTGAMGALQDWGVIWRFAYSHSDRNLFTPAPMGYFDLVTDPLNQAADRAAVMLYLRGDLKTAPSQVAMVLTRDELRNPPKDVPTMGQGPHWVTWVTKIGSLVVDSPADAPKESLNLLSGWSGETADGLRAFRPDQAKLLAELKSRGIISGENPTDPSRNIFMSETGEMLIDGSRGLLQFDTEKTAGGYADPGVSIRSERGGVEISDLSIGATVFVTSVDDQPIRSSRRLLVTHLTDLQNTESTYAESARQTLLAWGKLPHLVRSGTAQVSIRVDAPEQWKVYGLSTSGKRLAEVPHQVQAGALRFTCDVKSAQGARMMYEVVQEAANP